MRDHRGSAGTRIMRPAERTKCQECGDSLGLDDEFVCTDCDIALTAADDAT